MTVAGMLGNELGAKQAQAMGLRNAGFERRVGAFMGSGVLADEDVFVVDAVAERFGERNPEVLLGLAFAVRAPRAGHAGVNLLRLREHVEDVATEEGVEWPTNLEVWQDVVFASPMVGRADEEVVRPFVVQRVDGGELLLTRRMYDEQVRVAAALVSRARVEVASDDVLEEGIARLFGAESGGEAAKAVRVAAGSRLAVVSGGPGTGKTYSIKRLLALLIEGEGGLRIELAAPTGKAAVRMAEAMSEGLDGLNVADAVKDRLRALKPRTLHKLMGVRPDGSLRHTARNPIPADVVVVDEVSMVDLVMMRGLLEALGERTRLVLLGDKDQLASVEAGSVLGDLVRSVAGGGPMSERVVSFTRSRRFESAPDIARVAAELQRGDAEGVARAFASLVGRDHDPKESFHGRIGWLGAPVGGLAGAMNGETSGGPIGRSGVAGAGVAAPTPGQRDALAAPYVGVVHRDSDVVIRGYAALLGDVLAEQDAKAARLAEPGFQRELLEAFDRYRVLAVHRKGPLGVAGLERDLGERVRKHLLGRARGRLPTSGGHWLGRPILVTQNAYDVGLMNGDVGLVLPSEDGRLAAVFLDVGQGNEAKPKVVSLSRLPPHEGALAMTVHKSQGSQFDRVAVVLAGRPSPIQKRELIYTAITRAKVRVDWLGSEAELEAALKEGVVRTSGLAEMVR